MNNINIPIVRTKLVKDYDIELTRNKIFGIEEADIIFDKLIGGSTVEKVAILCLDSNNKVINASITNIGTDKKVDIVPSEMFRIALLSNASSIIICHNHPSGDLLPSKADTMMTDRMNKLCELMGIPLIDHVIVG